MCPRSSQAEPSLVPCFQLPLFLPSGGDWEDPAPVSTAQAPSGWQKRSGVKVAASFTEPGAWTLSRLSRILRVVPGWRTCSQPSSATSSSCKGKDTIFHDTFSKPTQQGTIGSRRRKPLCLSLWTLQAGPALAHLCPLANCAEQTKPGRCADSTALLWKQQEEENPLLWERAKRQHWAEVKQATGPSLCSMAMSEGGFCPPQSVSLSPVL